MERTALITGAAGGLGQAVAQKLDAAGWQLVLTSRDGSRLAACYGERHLQVEADCSTVAGARHILEAARAHGLAPTALAHCVGNIRLGALHLCSAKNLRRCGWSLETAGHCGMIATLCLSSQVFCDSSALS